MGVARLDHAVDLRPRRYTRLGLELPPVGLEARVVKLAQRARGRFVVDGAGLAGDDFDEDLATDGARGLVGGGEPAHLLGLEYRGVVRMIKAENLGDVVDRPFDQP